MLKSINLTHGSLFSGIGGFDLAANWSGIPTRWQVEKDPYCRYVLSQHFPETELFEDVTQVGKAQLKPVSIISGGFPCQPFSVAGKRKGKKDNRFLWPQMLRIISELKPNYVIGENVPGIISLALDQVLDSLKKEGYYTESFILPACGIGAWHKRERVWIIAYRKDRFNTSSIKEQNRYWKLIEKQIESTLNFDDLDIEKENSDKIPTWESAQFSDGIIPSLWQSEPQINRVTTKTYQRINRIKGLGNAIVPQMAYLIFKSIIEIETQIQELKNHNSKV